MTPLIIVLLAASSLISVVGALAYIRDIFRGTTKPNRVSWLFWGVAPLIGVAASFVDGARWALLPVFLSGFFPLLIFAVSFIAKNGYWKLTRFDYICGLLAALALILWAITKNPIVAIVFAILADFAAALPTLLKAWKHPETETGSAFIAANIALLLGLPAIASGRISEYAFSAYLILINSMLIIAVYHKRFKLKP